MDKRSFLKFFALSTGSLALGDSTIAQNGGMGQLQALAEQIFAEVISQNDYYINRKGERFFEALKDAQHPRATVIGCSDSRFQTNALDATPENDLFMIRNIGNQFSSNRGSVEYGIRHLHTPLLLIVGHSRCGAIKAAMGDFSQESPAIIRELDSLALAMHQCKSEADFETQWLEAVAHNVHQQTGDALKEFCDDVESGKLTIVGMVYDLGNDYHHGYGRLNIININGEKSSEKILRSPIMQSLFKPVRD